MNSTITTYEALQEYKRFTRDSSTINDTIGKQRIQHHYEYILSLADNYVIERTKVSSLKKDIRSYIMPPDYIKVNTVKVYIGSVWYPVDPVYSIEEWNERTGVAWSTNIPTNYIMRNEQGTMYLELNGIPSVDGSDNLEVTYEGYQDRLLFPSETSDGTITIASGESSVIGASTLFTSSMKGQFILPANAKYWYEIKSVGSSTALSLINYFQETSVSGVAYKIAELFRIPTEFSYTPIFGAAMDYYLPTNRAKSQDYERLYVRDIALLKNKYQSKTTGSVMKGISVNGISTSVPRNYPTSALRRI